VDASPSGHSIYFTSNSYYHLGSSQRKYITLTCLCKNGDLLEKRSPNMICIDGRLCIVSRTIEESRW